MSPRPYFVDNRNGNTLALAIRNYLEALKEKGENPEQLNIASAFFNPQGFDLISGEFDGIGKICLLLGAEPTPESHIRRRTPFDPDEPAYTQKRIKDELTRLNKALREERDYLPFDPVTDRGVQRLLEFLNSGKIEVRRYESNFLHAKAYIFDGKNRGVIAGSSNLTYAGLQRNLELNLGHYEDPIVEKVEGWFEELWEEAVPFDLAQIYQDLFIDISPYLIYLRVLWELYGAEIEEELEETHIPVTQFQKHGVWRAKRIIEKYGGVLVADGVGLGKTFTAGEIIREYRDRRQRVLLVCPASLRDTTWKKFLNDFQLLVESLSYEQLAADVQLGGDHRHLKNSLEDYALVVVDEAHNYRNPDTKARAAILRKLLSGKRRDLLLLSATPVNNSLWDLYHILRYFMKQDAVLADKGIRSIRERFHEAMKVDPFNLNPDMLYPVVDTTTVKRTRRFIKKYYLNDRIKGPDGTLMPITFPKPIATTISYDLDDVLPGFITRLAEILMPEEGTPLLTLARYKPENYIKGDVRAGEDTALVGLLRSGLLKRFESSAQAFAMTTSKMANQHEVFLDALNRGNIVSKEFFREFSASDEDDLDDLLESSEHVEDGGEYDLDALRSDVESDLKILREISKVAGSVPPQSDPKLAALIEELVRIATEAKNDGIGEEDIQEKRKVLVFSYFEDTINWIEDYLLGIIESDPRFASFKGRLASVSGTEIRRGIRREKAIWGFTPKSAGAPADSDDDFFDIMLTTDVLAEGVNLQQCRNIINFDLPWNPMRLVQRHGRIDRIGSPHKTVFMRTFFPDKQLDDLLNLEGRVRRKLAQAAASVGVEETPIEFGAQREQSFTENRDEIEKLHKQDASIYEMGGTEGATQTGEEYRQELRKALESYGEQIKDLPWKTGSGMLKGQVTGYFFCAKVDERTYLRFVPLDIELDIVSEIGTCLRLIECTEKMESTLSDDLRMAAYDAWDRAGESILQTWMYETDPANLQPRINKLNREVAEYIRANPPEEFEQDQLYKMLDAIETPWSRREENQLREVWNQEFDSAKVKSKALLEVVKEVGAEPLEVPEPLPPIRKDEIHLICWMAIDGEFKDTISPK